MAETSPEQQLQQFDEKYRADRAKLEQTIGKSPESLPSEYETMSRVTEGEIQQHVPSFQAASHAPRTVDDDSLPPEAEQKVQQWINDVFIKGRDVGIKEARDSGDPALMDAFHAALTGDLYEKLIASKKLEIVN